VGIWDDMRGLEASYKTIGQIAAVLALMPFGLVIRELNIPFVGVVSIEPWLGISLTLFWIVGIMNTLNFVDGIDGLAAGVTITILFALSVISIVTNQLLMVIVCIILAGSVVGFLRYNFPPASIFMGDCGAMFLGFVLAVISTKVIFQNPQITANSTVPVLIFGLPILDTTWAIVRRLKKRRSPFKADILHTHHRLVNIGFTQRQAAFTLYAASLLSVMAGLAIVFAGSDKLAIAILASMLVIALVGIAVLSRLSSFLEIPKPGIAPTNPDKSLSETLTRKEISTRL